MANIFYKIIKVNIIKLYFLMRIYSVHLIRFVASY